jgi:pimeloyl-ACP methyl ester carboxylesterase
MSAVSDRDKILPVRGKGAPMILVHGLYSSAKMSWEWPGISAGLAKRYQVIAPDKREHGQSDKPQLRDRPLN